MKQEEFNLSEKINKVCKGFSLDKTIAVPYVREFIKRLKEELTYEFYENPYNDLRKDEIIDKLIGDKLK